MDQIRCTCPYLGICFYFYNSAIFGLIWLNNFFGSSVDYYLSIGHEKFKLSCLFFDFDFVCHFWHKNGRDHHASSYWTGSSKQNQKFGPLTGTYGSTVTYKSCFQNFQAWTPLPLLSHAVSTVGLAIISTTPSSLPAECGSYRKTFGHKSIIFWLIVANEVPSEICKVNKD